MAPKKQKKASRSDADHDPESAAPRRTPEEQLWTALRRGDREQIEQVLFSNASCHGSDEVASLLARPTARRMLAQVNSKKQTPLTAAVELGLEPDLILLLLHAGADINSRDDTRERATALHRACLAEDEAVVQVLLKNGADVRVANAAGETPLHVLAASSSGADLARLVLTRIAAPRAGQAGVAAMDDASHSRLAGSTREGGESEEEEEQLRDAYSLPGRRPLRVDPLALLALVDGGGSTPLHIALTEAAYGSTAVASEMLDYLAETYARAVAAHDAHTEQAVRALLSAPRPRDGKRALHVLLSTPDGDALAVDRVLAKLLTVVPRPALDLFARDASGSTPLVLAVQHFTAAAPSDPAYSAVNRLVDRLLIEMATQQPDLATWEHHLLLSLPPPVGVRDGVVANTAVSLAHALVQSNNGAAAQSIEQFCIHTLAPQPARWLRPRGPETDPDNSNGDGGEAIVDLLCKGVGWAGDGTPAEGLLRALVGLDLMTAQDAARVRAVTAARANSSSAPGQDSDSHARGPHVEQDGEGGNGTAGSGPSVVDGTTSGTMTTAAAASKLSAVNMGNLTRAQRARRARVGASGGGGGSGLHRTAGDGGKHSSDGAALDASKKGINVPVAIVVALVCIAILVVAATPPADRRSSMGPY